MVLAGIYSGLEIEETVTVLLKAIPLPKLSSRSKVTSVPIKSISHFPHLICRGWEMNLGIKDT